MKNITTEKILLEYDPTMDNLLPALKKISAVFGYVSQSDAQKIADYFSIPFSKIYETASFYDLIQTEKQPRVTMKVCSSANCALRESAKIIKEIENKLHVKEGVGNNINVKLESVSCLGQCGEGPIMVVNDKIYKNVTRSTIHEILEEWI